ncbi:MAG: hypothetical protein ABIH59_02625 [archaeon]
MFMKFMKFGKDLFQIIRTTRRKVMIEIPENCATIIIKKLKGGKGENELERKNEK